MSQPSPCSTAEQEAHEESAKESKEEELLETVGSDETEKPELNAEETETKCESKEVEKEKILETVRGDETEKPELNAEETETKCESKEVEKEEILETVRGDETEKPELNAEETETKCESKEVEKEEILETVGGGETEKPELNAEETETKCESKEVEKEKILETVGGDETEKPELNAEETETKCESKEVEKEKILETVGGDETEKPELNAEETETKCESKEVEKEEILETVGGDETEKPELNADKTVSNLNQESEEPMQIGEDLSDTERNSESADLSFSEGTNIGNTDDYYASGGSGSEREIEALKAETKTKSVKSKEKSVKSKAKRSQSQRLMTDFVKQKPNKDNNKSKKSHSISDSGSETDPVDSGDSEEKHTSVAAKTTKKKKMGNIIHKGIRIITRQVVRSRNAREKSSDSDDDFTKPSLYKSWSDKDTEHYRQGYPGKREDPKATANKDFYFNERPSDPEGDKIENIHKKWKGDYHLLERHHGYIQWLFPIRESGMNWHAQELQLHEAKAINKNEKAHNRVLESYKLMLDFYGIELADPKTGEVKRSENWRSQFQHLNRSMHNYLRITRILKSLGEFDYEHLKEPFVKFMMTEALKKKTLPNVASSCMNYWVGTIKDDEQRKNLRDYATKMGYEERKY